ncbi:DMT family transporter [Marinisporobacter balticus]|nr:DMT family transporter [Marinisporobacter balticus]
MYIILAVLIGVAIVVATILNGKLSQKIGVVNDVMINYFMASIVSILLCFITREHMLSIEILIATPVYYFLGGFIGLGTIFLLNITVPKIPAVYIVIVPFIGQILTSAVIDYFYLDIFSKGKIIGGCLFLVGLLYNARVDKKYKEDMA